MHLLETEVQASIAKKRYGRSMVHHLDTLGLLTDRLSTAHTIWLDDDDIALMAARGSIPVHNPESNLKLGTGIAPIAKMLHAGVTVALGTDGASTNDNLDMHEVMRLALMLQRPGEPDRSRWPKASDAIAMATVSGGKAMRCAGLGTLVPGAPADLVLHDLRAPSWIPLNDPHVGALHLSAVTPEAMQIYRQGRGSVVAMDGHGVTDHTDWGPMPVDASLSGGFNLVIFPNLIVLRSQIRTVRPIAVDRTEIYTNAVRLQNVAEDVNLRRMRDQEFEFGAAGTFFTDDLEIFERTQEGLQSGAVDWVVFARGLDREEMRNGYMTGSMSDETQHRGMYQNWKRMMTSVTSPALAAE
jgi:hypothetical protein